MASSDDVGKKISQLHQEVANILEIVHENGTTVLDGIEPAWTSDMIITCFAF